MTGDVATAAGAIPTRRWRRKLGTVFALAVSLGIGGCGGMTDPSSPQASRINSLWWTMFVLSCAVFIAVVGLIGYALFRRRGESVFERKPRSGTVFVVVAGGIIPLVILAGVFGYSLDVMRRSGSDRPGQLVIEITGHQFWYDVRYPSEGLTTRNEMHVPVGRQVKLILKSSDVIHSFWVPQLNGKTDLIPGTANATYFTATDAGTWSGHCAEFCGIGHTAMGLTVTAESQDSFDSWLASHRSS